MKDHKYGFQDRISCRLTISSKSDTGKISKSILNHVLKGNEALEKNFFFFSKARKYGEEIKIKKKIKIPLFPASQTTF